MDMDSMVREVADRALQEIEVNGLPLVDLLDKLGNAIDNDSCNMETCRYNLKRKCQNSEKREECVRLSGLVLCLYEADTDDTEVEQCQ